MPKVEVIYSADSFLRHPGQFFRELWGDLRNSKDLAWRLFVRDFHTQYRQSLLGFFWAIFPPLMMALGFSLAREADILAFKDTPIPYPLFVLIGMVFWQLFSRALLAPGLAFAESKSILSKIKFPLEAVILSKIYDLILNFLIRIVLIAGALVYFEISPDIRVLWLPFATALFLVFGLALGVLLAPMGALYGDIQRMLALVINVWIYLTPIIYPVPGYGKFGIFVHLNPVTPFVVTTRELLTGHDLTMFGPFLMASAGGVILFALSWIFFRISIPFVVERVS